MPFDKENAKQNLKDILDKMQSNTDSTLLHEYYKLFKKEISFFRRSWAAAWLFMYYDGKEKPQNPRPEQYKKSRYSQANMDYTENNTEKTLPNIPEEESKQLFISIGKNRRLFPKEIITLIMTRTSTLREDIGLIRILDNYSFVQVRDNKADEIIEKLTGHRFRGRTLAVNYAKPRSGEENSDD